MNDVNMKIELYQILFTGCLILAMLFLMITILLFFRFHMMETIGYLTGKNEKKAIQLMRQGSKEKEQGKFVIVQEIMLLHTNEMIGEGNI